MSESNYINMSLLETMTALVWHHRQWCMSEIVYKVV